jgi:hypothetical protein
LMYSPLPWFLAAGSSRGRRQKHGEDVVHAMKVSLEDIYNGTTKKLSLSRNILCPKCKGYGPLWAYFRSEFFRYHSVQCVCLLIVG